MCLGMNSWGGDGQMLHGRADGTLASIIAMGMGTLISVMLHSGCRSPLCRTPKWSNPHRRKTMIPDPTPKPPQTSAGEVDSAGCAPMTGSGAMVMRMLPIIDNVATGEEIRKRREAAKVSLRKVAESMGWSAAYQSDLELGRRGWTETKCLEVECVIARFSRQNE